MRKFDSRATHLVPKSLIILLLLWAFMVLSQQSAAGEVPSRTRIDPTGLKTGGDIKQLRNEFASKEQLAAGCKIDYEVPIKPKETALLLISLVHLEGVAKSLNTHCQPAGGVAMVGGGLPMKLGFAVESSPRIPKLIYGYDKDAGRASFQPDNSDLKSIIAGLRNNPFPSSRKLLNGTRDFGVKLPSGANKSRHIYMIARNVSNTTQSLNFSVFLSSEKVVKAIFSLAGKAASGIGHWLGGALEDSLKTREKIRNTSGCRFDVELEPKGKSLGGGNQFSVWCGSANLGWVSGEGSDFQGGCYVGDLPPDESFANSRTAMVRNVVGECHR